MKNIRERADSIKQTIKLSGVMVGRKIMGVKTKNKGIDIDEVKNEFNSEIPEDLVFRKNNADAVTKLLKDAGFFVTKATLDAMLISCLYIYPMASFSDIMSKSITNGGMDDDTSNEINRNTLFAYGLICLLEDKESELSNINL